MSSTLEPRHPGQQFELVIPVDPAMLGSFITELLRKPQTIRQSFRGSFDIGKQEIVNIFHLVDQRVLQQNRGNLVQFTVTVAYTDGSTVTINSLDDFQTYAEVRPQVSHSVDLSWTYLLYFQGSLLPEKQTIELSIITSLSEDAKFEFSSSLADHMLDVAQSGCKFRIHHSLRSWGVDIESLLTGHIQSWIQKETGLKSLISHHPFLTGIASGLVLLSLLLFGIYQLSVKIELDLLSLAQSVTSLSVPQKIDWLIDQTIRETVNTKNKLAGALTALAFVISLVFSILMARLAANPQRSFVVLSDATKVHRERELKAQRNGWGYFIASGVTATIAGVASRYLFALIA